MDGLDPAKKAAAIAWVEQWYATPDEQPPGYWDAFEALLEVNPVSWEEPQERVGGNEQPPTETGPTVRAGVPGL